MAFDVPDDGAPAPADDTAMDGDQAPAQAPALQQQGQQLSAPPTRHLPKPEILDKLRRWADPNQTINILDELDGDTTIGPLGQTVCRQRDIDDLSRADWLKESEVAMDLAMQVAKAKSFPWPEASNVVYPIVSLSAVQFNARAYPAIVPDRNVVKGAIFGNDDGIPAMGPDGQPILGPDGKPAQWMVPPGAKRARGDRIAEHMSYQLLEEMCEWQEETDRLLLILPIVGCAFRKTYFDSGARRNFSVLAQAKDVIINYWAKSLETAPRITEELKFYPHEIEAFMRNGAWKRMTFGAAADGGDDEDAPHTFYEQHRFVDLDGDGLVEPYVVTVHKDTQTVVRIVARYEDEEGVIKWSSRTGDIVKVEPTHYYTKFDFLPNPQGGIYGKGFGQLLKPINESINTALNQLFDAGTLQNTGGGFIGRGLSMQTGSVQRKLGEWKVLNVPGNKIKEAIVPAPEVQPSEVLFKLLGFLVEAAKELGSNNDLMAGNQRFANMPATSVLALIEQGSKVFNGIYKRIYLAETDEFNKLYRLNRLYLDDVTEYRSGEEWKEIQRSDYQQGGSVRPISDPSMVSDMQRLARANVLQPFLNDPLIDGMEVRRRFFEAANMNDIDKLMQPNPLASPMLFFKKKELALKEIQARSMAAYHMARGFEALALGDKAVGDKHLAWLSHYMAMVQEDLDDMDTLEPKQPGQPPAPDAFDNPPPPEPGGDPPGVGTHVSAGGGMGFGGG